MIDHTELNRSLRRVVEQCTGMASGTVRPANQLAPATGESYATVLILNTSSETASHKWTNVLNDPAKKVTETATSHVLITVSVQIFRKNALLLANKLRDRITLTSALQLMQSLGLGYVSAKPVRDLTKTVNENWEERAAVDIDFYVVSTETDVVATYGRFPVTTSTGTLSTTTEVLEP